MPPERRPSNPGDPAAGSLRLKRRSRLRPLPSRTRILLYFLGWLLVLIGVAGLALPGIQGILSILLGAAVLSLASEVAYRLLRVLFRPWPRGWRRMQRFRRRLHDWLSRRR